MRKIVLCFIVVMVFASYASAARVYSEWRGAEGAAWNVPANWNNNIVPVAMDPPGGPQHVNYTSAGFKGPGSLNSPGITAGIIVAADQITIGGSTGGNLKVNGGIVNVSEYLSEAVSQFNLQTACFVGYRIKSIKLSFRQPSADTSYVNFC